jgi:translation elongation factor EF-Tu-like GTPase
MSYEFSKPQVNIGTIGHTGHGKTTLTLAIQATLGKTYGKPTPVDSQIASTKHGQSVVRYDTTTRSYTNFDCTGDETQMIPSALHMDAAILVVSATEDSAQQPREAIKLVRYLGVPYLVVYISKCDIRDNTENLELPGMKVELAGIQVRDLLSQYGYPGDDTPIVTGSGLEALEGDPESDSKILELVAHFDNYAPVPELTGATSSQDEFDAEVSILDLGGDQSTRTQAVEFNFRHEDSPVAGSIQLVTVTKDKYSQVRHGIKVVLNKKIMLWEGLHFYWKVGSEVKGYGRASKIKL